MQGTEQSKPAESDGEPVERPNVVPTREPARQRAKPAGRTATPGAAATPHTRIVGTNDSAARCVVRGSGGAGREQSRRPAAGVSAIPARESPRTYRRFVHDADDCASGCRRRCLWRWSSSAHVRPSLSDRLAPVRNDDAAPIARNRSGLFGGGRGRFHPRRTAASSPVLIETTRHGSGARHPVPRCTAIPHSSE